MYRIAADTIGFSVGDASLVSIYPSDTGNFIQGLNINLTNAGVPSGIQRLSAVAANSWEDGHMGNSERIVFTPADMVVSGAGDAPKSSTVVSAKPAGSGAADGMAQQALLVL